MVRLKDIAERAGVSLMTVSKVLHDAPDISAATKARIRHLAAEMGYVPDALARGLRTRRTRLLGLVVPSFREPAFAEAAVPIEDRAHDHGYDLLVAQSHGDIQREERAIRRLLSRHVDGLLVTPVYRLAPAAAVYEELRQSGTPVVLLGQRAPFCSQFVSVETDERTASCRVTQHLIELGHRRIAFFAGPSGAPWALQQLEGYRLALRDAGLPAEDALVFAAGSTRDDGERAAAQMHSERVNATAIQAVTDRVALGAARHLQSAGLRIPQDISIAGFGDDPAGECAPAPLTTVRPPKEKLGELAADMLARLIRRQPVELKVLTAELLIRDSTGPAPKQT